MGDRGRNKSTPTKRIKTNAAGMNTGAGINIIEDDMRNNESSSVLTEKDIMDSYFSSVAAENRIVPPPSAADWTKAGQLLAERNKSQKEFNDSTTEALGITRDRISELTKEHEERQSNIIRAAMDELGAMGWTKASGVDLAAALGKAAKIVPMVSDDLPFGTNELVRLAKEIRDERLQQDSEYQNELKKESDSTKFREEADKFLAEVATDRKSRFTLKHPDPKAPKKI